MILRIIAIVIAAIIVSWLFVHWPGITFFCCVVVALASIPKHNRNAYIKW